MIWNVYFSSCFSILNIVLDYLFYWISYWKERCRFDCCRFLCRRPLLYYYYSICICCWTIIVTMGYSIRITYNIHFIVHWFDTGTASMSLLLIFYNLTCCYYYFWICHSFRFESFFLCCYWLRYSFVFRTTSLFNQYQISHC